MTERLLHPDRKEIARYVLARGSEFVRLPEKVERAHFEFDYPEGLGPQPASSTEKRDPAEPLPQADVIVITWTADEADALARVFTPHVNREHWHPYAHNFDTFKPQIRKGAPAQHAGRLGSYLQTTIGSHSVLAMKSELHMNQDGIRLETGTTLPVRDFFKQIIAEAQPKLVLTIGTAGSVFEEFGLGDVVITRAAKFKCEDEFKTAPFNGETFSSDWKVPVTHLDHAEELMQQVAPQLAEPPMGAPTKAYRWDGPPVAAPEVKPAIRLEGRDLPELWPILTTDYFEYGTSANRLDELGAAVEMGDAALGLACSEINSPPHWGVVRNMSDPVINGDLPAKEFRLNEQTTWAVGFYTAYGLYTSICGALTTWAVVAGLK
jgi:nucleoside phosphorylase